MERTAWCVPFFSVDSEFVADAVCFSLVRTGQPHRRTRLLGSLWRRRAAGSSRSEPLSECDQLTDAVVIFVFRLRRFTSGPTSFVPPSLFPLSIRPVLTSSDTALAFCSSDELQRLLLPSVHGRPGGRVLPTSVPSPLRLQTLRLCWLTTQRLFYVTPRNPPARHLRVSPLIRAVSSLGGSTLSQKELTGVALAFPCQQRHGRRLERAGELRRWFFRPV